MSLNIVSDIKDIPTVLLNHSSPSGDLMIWPITLGETCVGSMQHVLLRGRVWFHLSNAFRSGTLEIALILVMCLIDLACRSVEATCSLEQQTEQFDVWIQLLSLPCILLADVTQCLCLSGSVHLSVKW